MASREVLFSSVPLFLLDLFAGEPGKFLYMFFFYLVLLQLVTVNKERAGTRAVLGRLFGFTSETELA